MNKKENQVDYINYVNNVRKLGLIDNTNYKEHWGYITAHKDELECLYDIYIKGMSFLELGCGAGNVLRYADNIGYDVTGVDYNKELLKHSKNYKVLNKYFKDLEDSFFKQFDVIYAYRPLKDEQFNLLIERIKNNMKLGAYLITPQFGDIKYKK